MILDSYLLVTLVSVIVLLPLFVGLISRKTLDIFEPMYPITGFYFLLFAVQPLLLLQRSDPLTMERAFVKVLFCACVGLVFFYVGYYAHVGKVIGKRLPHFRGNWSTKRLYQIIFIFMSLAILSAVYFVFGVVKEDMGWILRHPLEFNNQYLKIRTGYLTQGILLLQKAYFILFAFSLVLRDKRAMIIAFILASAIILLYLPLGARWIVVVTILVPILIRHYYQNKRVKLHHVALVTPLLILMFGFMNTYRGTGQLNFNVSWGSLFTGTLSGDLLTPFNNFVYLMRALDSGQVGYQYGLYYLYLLVTPIPRALWSIKPVVSVEWMFTEKIMGSDPLQGPTYTMTVPGELYFNLNIGGIIVGMLLWGVFWRIVYTWLLENRHDIGCVVIYAVLLLNGFNSVRTCLETFIIEALVGTIPLIIAFAYIGRGILKPRIK